MEKLEIKRQISYSSIFPNGNDQLEKILKIIPSRSAIAWASYMLTKKDNKTVDQSEHEFFIPLIFKMSKGLQHTMVNYLQSISKELDSYVFIDRVSLMRLIESLLENHNESNLDVLESREDFSNLFIAYLLLCDEKLSHTTKALDEIESIESQMSIIIPEQIRYNDIERPKDYRVEFIRFYYFMIFCEENHRFCNYLDLFLQENKTEKWDDYLYFIFDTYANLTTNSEGATNLITIDPDVFYGKKFLDSMCIDLGSFNKSTDFTFLRSKPVYYHGTYKYSILSIKFFLDKMFQSFLFDLALVLQNHSKRTGINSYPELKSLVSSEFTEHYLFYEIIRGCFARTNKILVSGKELKSFLIIGEPDFYIRKGKNIFLFEFKDVMLNAKTKHCGSIEQIKSEIFEIFLNSTVEKSTGKQRKKVQAKGITQLLNVIETKLDVILQKVDKIEITDNLNVYPVIVCQDSSFDVEGIRYMLNTRFEELKPLRITPMHYIVKECVLIPFEVLIKLEDYFNDGCLKLDTLIDDYTLLCNHSEQNRLLPFGKFVFRKAYDLGYRNDMSFRFKNVLDSIVEKKRPK